MSGQNDFFFIDKPLNVLTIFVIVDHHTSTKMPVQVATASHEASRIGSSISSRGDQFAEDGLEVLKGAGVNIDQIKEMLQSSFDNNKLPSSIYASENGFVRSVISSYNEHHHLTLRPEDIWFAILTQISSYIVGNGDTVLQLSFS